MFFLPCVKQNLLHLSLLSCQSWIAQPLAYALPNKSSQNFAKFTAGAGFLYKTCEGKPQKVGGLKSQFSPQPFTNKKP